MDHDDKSDSSKPFLSDDAQKGASQSFPDNFSYGAEVTKEGLEASIKALRETLNDPMTALPFDVFGGGAMAAGICVLVAFLVVGFLNPFAAIPAAAVVMTFALVVIGGLTGVVSVMCGVFLGTAMYSACFTGEKGVGDFLTEGRAFIDTVRTKVNAKITEIKSSFPATTTALGPVG